MPAWNMNSGGYKLYDDTGSYCGYYATKMENLMPNVKYQVLEYKDKTCVFYFHSALSRTKFIATNAMQMKDTNLYSVSCKPIGDKEAEGTIIPNAPNTCKTKIVNPRRAAATAYSYYDDGWSD